MFYNYNLSLIYLLDAYIYYLFLFIFFRNTRLKRGKWHTYVSPNLIILPLLYVFIIDYFIILFIHVYLHELLCIVSNKCLHYYVLLIFTMYYYLF